MKEEVKKDNVTTQQETAVKKHPSLPDYDETICIVRFDNRLMQGQNIEFSYNKTVYNEHSGRLGHILYRYNLEDNEIYKLPRYIIDHLLSLLMPGPPKKEVMPTGEVKALPGPKINRFGCSIVPNPPPLDEISDGLVKKGK